MSSTASLVFVQQHLTRYGMTTYTILGSIGLLFNIIVFSQSAHRRNSCSLYMLATACCALIGLNVTIIPMIYEVDNYNPLILYPFYCEMIFYLRHAFNQMMRCFFILACADRHSMSSANRRVRAFSEYKIAIRVIPTVMIFWLFIGMFPAVQRTLINGKCDVKSGVSATLYWIYNAVVAGIIPLICMMMFCVLLKVNLQKIRQRIQPITSTSLPGNSILRKRDRDFLRMLLIEVTCYMSTMIPFVVVFIYKSTTQSIGKSQGRLQVESFLNYLTASFLLYLNNGLSFWIYLFVSRSFRLEFQNLIIKCYVSAVDQQTN